MTKTLVVFIALGSLIVLSGCTASKMSDESIGTTENITTNTGSDTPSLENDMVDDLPVDEGAETVTVNVQNFQYSPKSITIRKGDTVTWVNKDVIRHTATSDDGLFDENLPSKGTYSYTFTETGEYPYHCAPHPHMKGTIIVE